MRFPFFVVAADGDVRGAFPDAMDAEALADALGGNVLSWEQLHALMAQGQALTGELGAIVNHNRHALLRAMSEGVA